MSTDANKGFSLKIKNRMTNNVDAYETARSRLDLHCLHRYPFWSATGRVKGLNVYPFILR